MLVYEEYPRLGMTRSLLVTEVRLSEPMGYSDVKCLLSIVLFTMIFASQTLAQNAPTTTTGGGPDLTVQSTKGTGTLKDTTSHTTLDNGVVVSTSTGKDGKP